MAQPRRSLLRIGINVASNDASYVAPLRETSALREFRDGGKTPRRRGLTARSFPSVPKFKLTHYPENPGSGQRSRQYEDRRLRCESRIRVS